MKSPLPIDSRRALIIPGNHDETIAYAVEHFIQTAQTAIETKGAFFVALSGGSTPKEIYQNLSCSPYKERLDWKSVYLFWSDERSLPPTHPDNNYRMAMEAGLKTLPIPSRQIHRMVAENDIKTNAKLYEKCILNTLQGAPFDLVMLGMGEDGHTASLFPKTAALNETKRLVTPNYIPELKTWRMTFTFPLINAALHPVIYVLGEQKKKMLLSVFKPSASSPPLPIQNIGTPAHPALWIVDQPRIKRPAHFKMNGN